MKKSLVIIASALILAVGAAGTQRLRYDSTVFASGDQVGRRAVQVEYPPCVEGVREDRCIQLYERGVRRAYSRWLAAHGAVEEASAAGTRRYRPCRSRSDDNCQQVARTRTARAARRASPVRAVAARSANRARAGAVRSTRWSRAAAQRPVRARPQRQAHARPERQVQARPARQAQARPQRRAPVRAQSSVAPVRRTAAAPVRTPTRVVRSSPRPAPRQSPSAAPVNTPGI